MRAEPWVFPDLPDDIFHSDLIRIERHFHPEVFMRSQTKEASKARSLRTGWIKVDKENSWAASSLALGYLTSDAIDPSRNNTHSRAVLTKSHP